MSGPLVSVITPTYNHERYILPCVRSVQRQTLGEWEQIVVDDGSTDRTGEIVRAVGDPRVRYLRQDNLGPWRLAETYNRALELARGEFVAVLEGDDEWPAYKLAYQVGRMRESDTAMHYGRAALIDADGQPFGLYARPTAPDLDDVTTADLLLNRAAVQPTAVLIRTEALRQIGGFRGHPRFAAVDLSTWLPLSLAGRLLYEDVVLGFWRQHRTQLTANLPVVAGAYDVALDFVRELPADRRAALGVDRATVAAARRPALADDAWRRCQVASRRRSWREARAAAAATFAHGGARRRLGAAAAIGCGAVRVDFVPVMRALARLPVSSRSATTVRGNAVGALASARRSTSPVRV